MKLNRSSLFLTLLFPGILAAGDVGPAGVRLGARYDAMDVEHHWLPGRPVDWRTGDPDGRTSRGYPTHCDYFVESTCERLGVFMPHLGVSANDLARWLAKDGAGQGWKPVPSPFEAQRLANAGQVVVVAYATPPPHELVPGHIALVRPSAKSDEEIRKEGPQVVQAGGRNANSTPLKTGFHFHREAWKSADDFQVRFYVHTPPDGN
jgi:hypothetical protein